MSNSAQIVTYILSILTLFGDLFVVFMIFAFIFKKTFWSRFAISFIGKRSALFSFLLSLFGSVGSMLYSTVFSLPPCILCWIQRIFLFPQPIISALSFWNKKIQAEFTNIMLSIVGAGFAIYQIFIQIPGNQSSTGICSVGNIECSQILFMEFGYITLPVMALTLFAMIICIIFAGMVYKKRNMPELLVYEKSPNP